MIDDRDRKRRREKRARGLLIDLFVILVCS